jgi:hypothetical protein
MASKMVWCATNNGRNRRAVGPKNRSEHFFSSYVQLLQKLFQFGNESRLELQNLFDVLLERRAVFGIDV